MYDQYVASLYFTTVTMLTIGYGDIVPATNKERVFAIFAMLTGGVVFGALLSKVALIIDKRNPQAKAFSEKMGEFKAFIEDKVKQGIHTLHIVHTVCGPPTTHIVHILHATHRMHTAHL